MSAPLRQRPARLALALAAAVLLLVIALAHVEYTGSAFLGAREVPAPAEQAAAAAAPMDVPVDVQVDAPMDVHATPQPVPETTFADGDGTPLTLADFRGKTVLLNLWATWCAPCRHEMPTLDRLQAALGGPGFEVVALSIDRAGIDAVRRFYREIGIAHLAEYIDARGQAAHTLGAQGLPATLLIDRAGREIARRIGPAVWDTPEMKAFLESHMDRDREREGETAR